MYANDLGVTISADMKVSEQCGIGASQGNQILGLIRRNIQYNTIQYNTIQYNTIQYNTIQYNTIQYNTIKLYCPEPGNCSVRHHKI